MPRTTAPSTLVAQMTTAPLNSALEVRQRSVERSHRAAHGPYAPRPKPSSTSVNAAAPAGDEQRLLCRAAGFVTAPAPARARRGSSDGAADAAAGHLHHQHRQRKDQRCRPTVGAQLAEDVAVVPMTTVIANRPITLGVARRSSVGNNGPMQHLLRV